MAAGHPLGHPGCGPGPAGGGGPADRHRPGGRRSLRLSRGPRPRHGHGRALRRVRSQCPRLRGRGPRHVRHERDRRHRYDVAAGRGSARARSDPTWKPGLRPSDVTLGHWPQSMDLSTVGGWLACRGAGQYSTALREDRGHGRGTGGGPGRRPGHPYRWDGTAGGDRSRPDPDVRRAPKVSSASSPAPPSGSTPYRRPSDVGPTASRHSPTDWKCAGGSCAGGPRRPCSVSTTTPRAPATSTSPTTASSSSSTRPTPAFSTPPWPWWRPSAPPAPPPPWTRDWWSAGWRIATTSRPWPLSTAPASWSTPSRSPPAGRR